MILVIAAAFVAVMLVTADEVYAPPGGGGGGQPPATDVNCPDDPCIEENELTFDTTTQAEFDTHTANTAAHHGRYTDVEAVAAVGPHTADTKLTEAQVETFITNGVIDLFVGTTLGSAVISTGAHTADTTLTEAQVETFITNGVIDLFTGTTLGGASISTGSHTTRYTDTEAVAAVGPIGWTDDGAVVRLTTIDDNVGIGTTTPGAKLQVLAIKRPPIPHLNAFDVVRRYTPDDEISFYLLCEFLIDQQVLVGACA